MDNNFTKTNSLFVQTEMPVYYPGDTVRVCAYPYMPAKYYVCSDVLLPTTPSAFTHPYILTGARHSVRQRGAGV